MVNDVFNNNEIMQIVEDDRLSIEVICSFQLYVSNLLQYAYCTHLVMDVISS